MMAIFLKFYFKFTAVSQIQFRDNFDSEIHRLNINLFLIDVVFDDSNKRNSNLFADKTNINHINFSQCLGSGSVGILPNNYSVSFALLNASLQELHECVKGIKPAS